MTPEQFCYWLQGKLEGRDIINLDLVELRAVQDHLFTVFNKVTPTYTPNNPDTWIHPLTIDTRKNPLDPPYTVTC